MDVRPDGVGVLALLPEVGAWVDDDRDSEGDISAGPCDRGADDAPPATARPIDVSGLYRQGTIRKSSCSES